MPRFPALFLLALASSLSGPAAAGAPVDAASSTAVVVMQTEVGDIEIEIDLASAPVTGKNFLAYVDQDRFEGASFYRVVTPDNQPDNDIRIEVIQGGLGFDPHPAELPAIEHETTERTGLLHRDGVISMARLEPGTAASEFFICVGDQPELDFGGRRNPDGQGFAAFGRVLRGMEVVRKIQRRPEKEQMLLEPVKITEVHRAPRPRKR